MTYAVIVLSVMVAGLAVALLLVSRRRATPPAPVQITPVHLRALVSPRARRVQTRLDKLTARFQNRIDEIEGRTDGSNNV